MRYVSHQDPPSIASAHICWRHQYFPCSLRPAETTKLRQLTEQPKVNHDAQLRHFQACGHRVDGTPVYLSGHGAFVQMNLNLSRGLFDDRMSTDGASSQYGSEACLSRTLHLSLEPSKFTSQRSISEPMITRQPGSVYGPLLRVNQDELLP
jgi:hypothetical protein